MKPLKLLAISSFILLMICAPSSFAQVAFKGYTVTINNFYPYPSSLILGQYSPVQADVYCAAPPSTVIGYDKSQSFNYWGAACSGGTSFAQSPSSPYATYTLTDQNNNTITQCAIIYSYNNGSCSATIEIQSTSSFATCGVTCGSGNASTGCTSSPDSNGVCQSKLLFYPLPASGYKK